MYTDNLKGFRKRCMIKKLEILMKQIEDVIEFAYEEGLYDDYDDLREKMEHSQYCKERIYHIFQCLPFLYWHIYYNLLKTIIAALFRYTNGGFLYHFKNMKILNDYLHLSVCACI